MITRRDIHKPFKDAFRTKLHIEDVRIPLDDFVEYGICVRLEEDGEGYFIFAEAYKHPDFNMFYHSKVTGTKDPYFKELCLRLLYLNRGLTAAGMVKMAEYAIRLWVKMHKVDGEWVSTISNEEFFSSLKHWEKEADMYMPNALKVALFTKNTKLTKDQRKALSLKARWKVIRYHANQLAGNAVEVLAETKTKKLQKITHTRIAEVSKDTDNEITAYMSKKSEDTERKTRVEELNLTRPFKTGKTEAKYREFLELKEGNLTMPVRLRLLELGISNSTYTAFKKIANEWDEGEEDRFNASIRKA